MRRKIIFFITDSTYLCFDMSFCLFVNKFPIKFNILKTEINMKATFSNEHALLRQNPNYS